MYKIFVYGTLKSEYLQKKLLGHTLESYEAELEGYSINTGERYFNVLPNAGGCVKGRVLLVDKRDMLYIDQWEVIPMYMKAEVCVHSQYGYENVYIYIKKDKEEKVNLKDSVENMCNDEDLEGTIDEFADARDMEFPVCDIYLNYLIDMESVDFDRISKNKDLFTNELEEISRKKYSDTKKREFYFLGYEHLSYKSMDRLISVRVSLYYTLNNNSGILIVMLPVSTCNPIKLWKNAFEGRLKVEDTDFVKYIYEKYRIKVLSTPNIIIFSSAEIDEQKMLEAFEVGKIDGEDIIKSAKTDVSQNDDTKIYLSENVTIEIPKEFEACYKDRLRSASSKLLLDFKH